MSTFLYDSRGNHCWLGIIFLFSPPHPQCGQISVKWWVWFTNKCTRSYSSKWCTGRSIDDDDNRSTVDILRTRTHAHSISSSPTPHVHLLPLKFTTAVTTTMIPTGASIVVVVVTIEVPHLNRKWNYLFSPSSFDLPLYSYSSFYFHPFLRTRCLLAESFYKMHAWRLRQSFFIEFLKNLSIL